MDVIDSNTSQVPDAHILEDYLADRETGKDSPSLLGIAFAKPMTLIAVRAPLSDEPSTRGFIDHLERCGIAHASLITDDGRIAQGRVAPRQRAP